MNLKKTLVGVAVASSLGLGGAAANAAAVSIWDLQDFDGDGLKSDFNFFSAPSGNGPNTFGSAGETGCTGGACVPIAMDTGPIASNVFTTGFNFGGTGMFTPNIFGNIAADITGGALTFSALDFGGEYQGTQFNLAPDGGPGNVTVEQLTDLGGGTWGVALRYISTINEPGSSFHGFAANWRLEGVMATEVAPVPAPAAVWLFGAGFAGLMGLVRRSRKGAAA